MHSSSLNSGRRVTIELMLDVFSGKENELSDQDGG